MCSWNKKSKGRKVNNLAKNPRPFPTLLMNNIVTIITRIVNCHYLQKIIGRTHVKYLLLYLVGLLILDKHFSQTGMAERIESCHHDGINRMLRHMEIPVRTFESMLVNYIERYRQNKGWLIIDDTSINKRYSSKIAFTGYCWCSSLGRVARGMHIVTLFWTDGERKFPVGYRIWQPRDKVKKEDYKTKIDLARELVQEHLSFCLGCRYLVFDAWYCSKGFLSAMRQLGIHCISSLKSNRTIFLEGHRRKVSGLIEKFRDTVDLPGYGIVFVYCTKVGKRKHCLMSTDTALCENEVKERYKHRWPVEEFYRAIKQYLGFEDCQCRNEVAVRNHINLTFLGYVVLEVIKESSGFTHGEIKRALQKKFLEHDQKSNEKDNLQEVLKHVA